MQAPFHTLKFSERQLPGALVVVAGPAVIGPGATTALYLAKKPGKLFLSSDTNSIQALSPSNMIGLSSLPQRFLAPKDEGNWPSRRYSR